MSKSEFFILSGAVIAVLSMYMLFSIFVDGGILALFRDTLDTFSLKIFFGYCGEYAGRFFRLFLLWCGMTALLVVVALFLITISFDAWTANALSETDLLLPVLFFAVAFLFLLMLLVMVLSYAKIIIVIEGEKKVRIAVWRAVQFFMKNIFSSIGLQFILITAVAGLMILYLFIEDSIGMTSGFSVLIVAVLQQTAAFIRVWIRIAGYGSQVHFYQTGKYPPGELTELEDNVTAAEASV